MIARLFSTVAMKVAGGIIAALLIALAGAVWWGKSLSAELADVRGERDQAVNALAAERRANEADAKRQAEREARSTKSREAMRHAEDQNPEAARAPAGPVSRAAAERLQRRP